ncbi:unnamed protein product [Anisakis simplex]|uniref:Transcriptional regulator n=1 Tax=Anisakis simplex TaxID=6269 RepID=A0A0M3JKJ6_ANISI|nr:unnamed protein product [Anisakis simplex]
MLIEIADDAFALAEYGRLSYLIPLRMTEYLRKEQEVMPFFTFFTQFEYIYQRLYRHANATLMNVRLTQIIC